MIKTTRKNFLSFKEHWHPKESQGPSRPAASWDRQSSDKGHGEGKVPQGFGEDLLSG